MSRLQRVCDRERETQKERDRRGKGATASKTAIDQFLEGVPTTLPCTAPHKRELARLQAMIDNENQNNPGAEKRTIDISESELIKNCYFCAFAVK